MKQHVLLFFVLALLMFTACGGKKNQAGNAEADNAETTITEAAIGDSTATSAQEETTDVIEELTFANMAGIYDDEKQESRFCLNEDGTATWGMIGSLNYTEYTYTIDGNTICLRPKGVETEDDCYDYDKDTRTLRNEQGGVYYRQAVE